MKICFLTDEPSPFGGGSEHIRHVSKLLREKGVTVDVVTPLSMDPEFNVHSFWRRVKYTFWIVKFLFTTSYDIYHSHTFSTSSFLPLVKPRGKKTGVTIHGAGKELLGGGVLNKIFVPQFLRFLVLDVWPFDFRFSASHLSGFVTVGNGVDVKEFESIARKPHQKFTVLCIARRDPVKGIDILEKAVAKLPGVKLHLVSGRMRTMADFAAADLYVLPSLSEGFPIVLLEAMAAKLPIVATDVGDCKKLVEKANCGLIVQSGNVEALAQAIKTMIANKNRVKMGERGFAYVKAYHSWEKVATVYYSVYTT